MTAPLSVLGLLLIFLCTSNTYADRVGPIITAGNLTCDFTPYLIPFVDALEIPAKAVLQNNKYTLKVSETPGLKLHRDLPPTTMWVYNGQFPGPTFDVQKNQAIHVTIVNNLPINRPLLPIQDLGQGMPPDRIVVHLHGGVNKPQYCGHPLDFVRPYNGSNTYTNYYANQQDAAGLWYHDHVMGLTVPNVYGGMAGAYFIRDNFEDLLNLPQGEFEIPLIISAKEVNLTTGQLYMQFLRSPPLIPNYNLVNNKIWPYLEVSQNRYRFRLLNAANHRTYHLYSDPPMTMHVIGSDNGFLDKTAVTSDLFLGTGERYDVIIDFSDFPIGTNITLMNDALDPFSNGTGAAPGVPIPCPGHFIMQFRVTHHAKIQLHNNIPNIMRYPAFNYRSDNIARLKHRNFTLFQPLNPKFQIDGKPFLSRLHPYVPLGSSEVWTFINYNDRIAHPIHIHLVNFRVLSRQYVTINNPYIFNNSHPYIEGYPTQPYMITPRLPATGPNEYEKGPKDIVITYPNSVTSILIENFGPYTGEYIWHCHALDHEENDMMQRWAVVPRGPDCQQDDDQWDHC